MDKVQKTSDSQEKVVENLRIIALKPVLARETLLVYASIFYTLCKQ
jgi:hypothetical protein